MTNTFIKGVGRLSTDRYDFQNHIEGKPPHHKAGIITLDPSVVINGVTHTNVQNAIEELTPFAVTVPDASASVKGIIKLGGDIAGTADSPICQASYILKRPLGVTPPTAGQVLTWTGVSWSPATIPVQFVASGDLQGTSLNQEIISITGLTNNCTIKCSNLTFDSAVISPTIQQDIATTTNGADMIISAQSSSRTASYGGNLILSAGFGSAYTGTLKLQISTLPLLEIARPTSNNYVLSLVKGSDITNTEMPTGTGNRVIYIANAVSNPTVSPVDGSILYSSNGNLWIKESNGDNFQINDNNKIVFQDSSYQDNNSSSFTGWNDFFSTTSENYDYAMWTGNYVAQLGDVVKITFSGYVSNSSGDSGYACILINGLLGDIYMPGGEIYIDLPSTSPTHITLSSIYTITVPDTIRAVAAMKVDPDASGTMYMYGGASLIIEVLRP